MSQVFEAIRRVRQGPVYLYINGIALFLFWRHNEPGNQNASVSYSILQIITVSAPKGLIIRFQAANIRRLILWLINCGSTTDIDIAKLLIEPDIQLV